MIDRSNHIVINPKWTTVDISRCVGKKHINMIRWLHNKNNGSKDGEFKIKFPNVSVHFSDPEDASLFVMCNLFFESPEVV